MNQNPLFLIFTFVIVQLKLITWELSYNLKIVTATSNFRGQREEEEQEPNRIRIQKTELAIGRFGFSSCFGKYRHFSLQHSALPFSAACCLTKTLKLVDRWSKCENEIYWELRYGNEYGRWALSEVYPVHQFSIF